jgi:hypothetical protein
VSKSETKVSAAEVADLEKELDQEAREVPRALARGEAVPKEQVKQALLRLGSEAFHAEQAAEERAIKAAALRAEIVPLQAELDRRDAEGRIMDEELAALKIEQAKALKALEDRNYAFGQESRSLGVRIAGLGRRAAAVEEGVTS